MILELVLAALAQDAPMIGPPVLYQACPQETDSDEIVVCGNPDAPSPLRLGEPLPEADHGLPEATVMLSDATSLSAEAEGVEIGGQQSNRAMIRVRIGF